MNELQAHRLRASSHLVPGTIVADVKLLLFVFFCRVSSEHEEAFLTVKIHELPHT